MHARDDVGRIFPGGAEGLRECYGDWLAGFSWQTFGTFTFRNGVSPTRAGTIFHTFLGGDGDFTPELVVWGAEPHKSGRGHVHALIAWHPWCNARAEAFALSASWRRRYGHCMLARYDSTRGAAYYLTKYVLKEARGSGDWDVWKGVMPSADHMGERELVRPAGGRTSDQEARRWETQYQVEARLDEETQREIDWAFCEASGGAEESNGGGEGRQKGSVTHG